MGSRAFSSRIYIEYFQKLLFYLYKKTFVWVFMYTKYVYIYM